VPADAAAPVLVVELEVEILGDPDLHEPSRYRIALS
jgi:hypothetical protein